MKTHAYHNHLGQHIAVWNDAGNYFLSVNEGTHQPISRTEFRNHVDNSQQYEKEGILVTYDRDHRVFTQE